jgi:hypothetical protein
MIYTEAALAYMKTERIAVTRAHEQLLVAFASWSYSTPRGREYAIQGFLRRSYTMQRCVDNVFRLLPPEVSSLPEPDKITDAEINLQAFIFNVFGSIDNLAWVLIEERGFVAPAGERIPDKHIGLMRNNKTVRACLSTEFNDLLQRIEDWFEYIEKFRHAVAHRVPIYVPPYVVYGDDDDREFRPMMTHSFTEASGLVGFHAQMLDDCTKVEEIARMTLMELGARSA